MNARGWGLIGANKKREKNMQDKRTVTASEILGGRQSTLAFSGSGALSLQTSGSSNGSVHFGAGAFGPNSNVTINVHSDSSSPGKNSSEEEKEDESIVKSSIKPSNMTSSKGDIVEEIDEEAVGEKRPRSLPTRMERKQQIVCERYKNKYNSYQDHKEKIEAQIIAARAKSLDDVVETLNETLVGLKDIWGDTCEELKTVEIDIEDSDEETEINMPAKRSQYTDKEKTRCVKFMKRCVRKNLSIEHAIKTINLWSGFANVRSTSVMRWSRKVNEDGEVISATRTGGRKTNPDFDAAVLSKLVCTFLDKSSGDHAVLANAAYSYDIIKTAALATTKERDWGKGIEHLKFSDTWIKSFLERMSMRKLRVTSATNTKMPSQDLVEARMTAIQELIKEHNLAPDDVFNADETGICPAELPINQYVPEGTSRASAPPFNTKERLTAMIGASSSGNFLGLYIILKCSIKQSAPGSSQSTGKTGRRTPAFGDLSSSTLLTTLLKDEFTTEDGWTRMLWVKDLPYIKNGQTLTITYKRPYLLNEHSGAVITVHNKAWMDAPGICMWIELVVKPWAKGRTKLLVWDNCPSHNTEAVLKCFEDAGVLVENLPPNMTDKLQVMDLVVNGPLKAHMRKLIAEKLYDSMQIYRSKVALAVQNKKEIDLFRPVPPKPADCIRMLRKVMSSTFASDDFKHSLQRTFTKLGLAKEKDGTFKKFIFHNIIRTPKGILAPASSTDLATLTFDYVQSRPLEANLDADNDNEHEKDTMDDNDDDEEEEEYPEGAYDGASADL